MAMGQWMTHAKRHPQAGLWGQSKWLLHYLEWEESGDGSPTDGGSLCGVYMGPPYIGVPSPRWRKCSKCARLASSA